MEAKEKIKKLFVVDSRLTANEVMEAYNASVTPKLELDEVISILYSMRKEGILLGYKDSTTKETYYILNSQTNGKIKRLNS